MAYDSCGACFNSSVALFGSAITNPFICDMISSSCVGGRVERVRDMVSGQVRPGGRSTPGGSGGKAVLCWDCGATVPFGGGGT